jgi:hypothetical protein
MQTPKIKITDISYVKSSHCYWKLNHNHYRSYTWEMLNDIEVSSFSPSPEFGRRQVNVRLVSAAFRVYRVNVQTVVPVCILIARTI